MLWNDKHANNILRFIRIVRILYKNTNDKKFGLKNVGEKRININHVSFLLFFSIFRRDDSLVSELFISF